MRIQSFGLVLLLSAAPGYAQAPPAPPAAPAPDTPSISVGVTLFADYTFMQEPKIRDAEGNDVTLSAFQITRSYINVTGNVTRHVVFRITPDVARETGVGSSLNGSYTLRLKFAYAQWNLDDHMPAGSFARLGMQPNPYFELMEPLYRYRFQGTLFNEREGYQVSADVGAAFHYSLPNDYGDIQTGFFNGEGFNKAEVNDQKAFMFRGTVRPLRGRPVAHGLRLTGFINKDAYVKNADRMRAIFAATFEHAYLNAAFEYIAAKDQRLTTEPAQDGRGWSVFVTPKTARGWEGLLRFDHLVPSKALTSQIRKRTIAGVAYWFARRGNLTSALLFDVDNAQFEGFSPARATERRIAVHSLLTF